MAVWPVGLPQQVAVTGYQGAPRDNRIDTKMETGPPKSRRRSTAAMEEITCGQELLTKAQIAILQAFYETTLLSGTLPFDWVHPLTGAAVSMRFGKKPTWTMRASDALDVSYLFWILP